MVQMRTAHKLLKDIAFHGCCWETESVCLPPAVAASCPVPAVDVSSVGTATTSPTPAAAPVLSAISHSPIAAPVLSAINHSPTAAPAPSRDHASIPLAGAQQLWAWEPFFLLQWAVKGTTWPAWETGCRWSPCLGAPAWGLCGVGKKRTGKGRVVEKLEKQNSFVVDHTLNKPELFCHPQTEWEYFFPYFRGIKNSHHSLPMPRLYCLSFKQILAQLMIQSTCFCPLHLT